MIDGADQLDFFLGKQENSNREGFPAYVADRLSAVKWHNWKMHLIWQVNMCDPPVTLPEPKVDGLDVEPGAREIKTFGFRCRTYSDDEGRRSGLPPVGLIQEAARERRSA